MRIRGRYMVVLATMCGLLASGVGLVTNVSGLFFSPVASEFGILKGAASLMITICNISFALGGMVAPRLLSEKSLKPLLVGATATLAASTAALALCPGIVPMYVLCVLRGFSAGLVGFVFVTMVLNNWFVENIGLATSIAMGCSGLAGAAFSPIVSGVIGAAGWRAGFVLLGVLTVCLNLPAILFLPAIDPATKGIAPLGGVAQAQTSVPKKEAPAKKVAQAQTSAEKKVAPAIKAAQAGSSINMVLFVAVIGYTLFASALTALPQHFPGLAESYALGVGAAMISASMVANTVGKIILGVLIDKIGTKVSVLAYAVLICVSLVLLLLVRGPVAMVVAAALFGLCYALATVGISMVTRDAFGLDNYGKTYPTISLVGNVANAVFSSTIGFMYDFSGGYASTLVMFLAMLLGVVGIVFFVYAHAPRGKH